MHSGILSIALNGTLTGCLIILSQVSSQNALKHTPEHAFKYTPNCTEWQTHRLLDCMLPRKLLRCSQSHLMVYSQPAWLYPPNYALEALSSALHDTASLFDCTIPSKGSRRSQIHSQAHSQPAWLYAPKYALKTLWSTLPSTLLCTLSIALDVTRSLLGSRLQHTFTKEKLGRAGMLATELTRSVRAARDTPV
jgi:hypothetical protein